MHLAEHLRFWAAADPSRSAVETSDRIITWRELDQGSDEIASGLRRTGLVPGDRLAILLTSRPEYIELVAACLKAGIIVCPLNIRLTPFELLHQIRDSGCRVIITENATSASLSTLVDDLEGVRLVCFDGEAGPGYESLRDVGAGALCETPPNDGAFLCYTSGTTGTPKAALLTHASVRGAGIGALLSEGTGKEDRVLSVAPMYVTNALVSNLAQSSFIAGATFLMDDRLDPEHLLDTVVTRRVTATAFVPHFYKLIAASPRFAVADLSHWRRATTGGPDLTEELVDTYRARGIPINTGYGQTEMSGLICWGYRPLMGECPESVGRPTPGLKLRIVDDEDQDVSAGARGEIVVQGPGVMREYWNLPDATSETERGGWHHTGDIGSVDAAGYVYIHDRKKDMIRSGGSNVFPAEIEAAVRSMLSDDAEVAVIGVPHAKWGEVGMLVVGNGLPVDIPALRDVMGNRLARYKHPYYLVSLIEALPRNASGKIRKVDLRARYPQVPPDAIHLRE